MASTPTLVELRNMSLKDLKREETAKRALIGGMSLAIKMQKEKNTAKYRRKKKELAKILTVIGEKDTVPAPTIS